MVRNRTIAVFPFLQGEHAKSVKVAAVLFASQCSDHLGHKVVDVEQFQLHARIVHGDGQVVGDVVAESGDGTIVVRPAPLAEKVGEAVYQHLGTRFVLIPQEQLFARLLASAVFGIAETTRQRGLLRRTQHHRACVMVLLQHI